MSTKTNEKNEVVETVESTNEVELRVVNAEDEEDIGSAVIFSKPYKWEDKEYTGIDLANMANLNGNDLIEAVKKTSGGGLTTTVNSEYELETILLLVSMATGKPIEFFRDMPVKEVIKIKYKAISFL